MSCQGIHLVLSAVIPSFNSDIPSLGQNCQKHSRFLGLPPASSQRTAGSTLHLGVPTSGCVSERCWSHFTKRSFLRQNSNAFSLAASQRKEERKWWMRRDVLNRLCCLVISKRPSHLSGRQEQPLLPQNVAQQMDGINQSCKHDPQYRDGSWRIFFPLRLLIIFSPLT